MKYSFLETIVESLKNLSKSVHLEIGLPFLHQILNTYHMLLDNQIINEPVSAPQMCKEDCCVQREGEEESISLLSELKQTNPEKLKR